MQNMIDIGILTSMKQLPVMQLNYGGAFITVSSIKYDLGPLKCTGKVIGYIVIPTIGPLLLTRNRFYGHFQRRLR